MKKFISLCTALVILFCSTVAYAKEKPNDTKFRPDKSTTKFTSDKFNVVNLEDGSALIFETEKDYQSYLRAKDKTTVKTKLDSTDIQTMGIDYVRTPISSEVRYYKWVGYHPGTADWRTADSHTLESGRTFNVSTQVTYKNVSATLSLEYSYSVSSSLPADPTRYSRLGVYADYIVSYSRYDIYEYGTWIDTYYVTSATPLDRYVTVVYKN